MTEYLTRESFKQFVEKYRTIILKPVKGMHGKGVIKVSSSKRIYTIHHKDIQKSFSGQEQVWTYIQLVKEPKRYIVQQYIPLASIESHPFDVRVMVQRVNKEPWLITGNLAKIAKPNLFVTNMASGGTIVDLTTALLSSNINERSTNNIIQKINHISLRTVEHLSKIYRTHTIWGLDIGIDISGRPWIIEVNADPNIFLFRRLNNRSLYHRIRKMKFSR